MAHKHSVYDTDTHFKIDGATRAVKNVSETKAMLVQYDHNSERFTFEVPRYVDGHDLSLCNAVRVHYNNIEKTTRIESNGVYEVTDLRVSPDDETVVICSWLISNNATQLVGSLYFVLQFACEEDREIVYSWNTAIHTGVFVTDGIYNGEEISSDYADILQQWKNTLFGTVGTYVDGDTLVLDNKWWEVKSVNHAFDANNAKSINVSSEETEDDGFVATVRDSGGAYRYTDLEPTVDNAQNIGSDTKRISQVHANQVHASKVYASELIGTATNANKANMANTDSNGNRFEDTYGNFGGDYVYGKNNLRIDGKGIYLVTVSVINDGVNGAFESCAIIDYDKERAHTINVILHAGVKPDETGDDVPRVHFIRLKVSDGVLTAQKAWHRNGSISEYSDIAENEVTIGYKKIM